MTPELQNAIENIGGRVKSILDTVEMESGKRKALEQAVASLREGVERFTKQLPGLRGSGGGERDSEYGGFWPNAVRAAEFGHSVLAAAHPNGDVRRACAEALTTSSLTLRNVKGQFVKGEDYVKAMAGGVDTAGGYLVADELAKTIIRHVEEFGVARKRLTKAPMSTERMAWPKRADGYTVYYPDEGEAPTASDLTLAKVTLTAKKWAILTFFSKELEEDSVIALGELIGLEVALALSQAEDANTFLGDGTSAYAGITGVFGSAQVSLVTMGAGDVTFDAVTYDDLIDLKRAVPSWVRKLPDCAYFMSPDLAGICEKLKDGEGLPMFQRPTEAFPLRVAGHEVVESSVLPDNTESDVSTKFLAFGSLFAWGILGIRRAMTLEKSTEVRWLEDQVAVKAVPRQDVQEAFGEAMAVLRTAAA